ncbi:MAG: hypothetical protein HZA93_03705 [Verrucomicrobia bacterium]|nr:hypothetical protein [Verrucomicrobiota bacterium]
MNIRALILFAPFLVAVDLLAQATAEPAPAPPPVVQAIPPATAPLAQNSGQRVYVPVGGDTLIARPTADGILEGFKKVYHKSDGAPRVVIYVNRALIDTASGVKLTGLTEKYYTDAGATKTSGDKTYAVKDAAAPTLADQQTVREIERLFGRVFRNAGATLADQKTATSLLPEQAGTRLVGDQAAKDREALAQIADIAIEVLISSRNLTVPEVSGDATYTVPDIQATAIRLKDSAIVGQAAASDILGRDLQAGRIIKQFGVRDITEATALALMDDMLTGKKS